MQSAQSALKEGSNWKLANDSISFIGESSRMIRTAERGIPTFRSQIISLLGQNTQPIDPNFRVQFLINLQPEKKPL